MQFVTQSSNDQTDLECIPDIIAQLSIEDTLNVMDSMFLPYVFRKK